AKDQYFSDPDKFRYFETIFDTIRQLSVTKNYYNADLFNIEEILSILEMEDQLEGTSRRERFATFIRDVINYYTPPCVAAPQSLASQLFGADPKWQSYGAFIAAILNCCLPMSRNSSGLAAWKHEGKARPDIEYSIVTLNYDLIPEIAANQISKATGIDVA